MGKRQAILVSACLLGVACRYDGRDNAVPEVIALSERFELIPVCPEQLGGLSTPREPSERRGEGVFTRLGADVTDAFERGAHEACRLAARFGAQAAILKARSPSCGAGQIYDGTFSGKLVEGSGVTAQALSDMGVVVLTEQQIERLPERFGGGKE